MLSLISPHVLLKWTWLYFFFDNYGTLHTITLALPALLTSLWLSGFMMCDMPGQRTFISRACSMFILLCSSGTMEHIWYCLVSDYFSMNQDLVLFVYNSVVDITVRLK